MTSTRGGESGKWDERQRAAVLLLLFQSNVVVDMGQKMKFGVGMLTAAELNYECPLLLDRAWCAAAESASVGQAAASPGLAL